MSETEVPFYGSRVYRRREQDHIRTLLRKYQNELVSDELKKQVYDDLMREKYLGHITIPFRVVLRKDAYGKYPNRIEVILDTKV